MCLPFPARFGHIGRTLAWFRFGMVHGCVLGCRLFPKSCMPLSLEVFWVFHRRCCAACFFVVEPQRHFLAWSHHQICLLLMPQKWRWGLFCVYMEKADNAWHRRGKQKTGNTYNQPKRPSTGTPHGPSTRHYRKVCNGNVSQCVIARRTTILGSAKYETWFGEIRL